MKKQKLIYWISTSIFSLFMLFSAIVPLVNSEGMKAANVEIDRWGFPHFFHIEWEIAKILGAIALIVPFVPKRLKEFAYDGFIILLVSALITHFVCGDPISYKLLPTIFLILLVISYRFYILLNKTLDSSKF